MKIEKRNFIFVLGGVLLLFLGFVIGRMSNRGSGTLPLPPTPTPTLTSVFTPSPTLEVFKVTRVIDGDTIEIENGERVRYLGINTPEIVDLPVGKAGPRKHIQCLGVEASKKNKELVEGKTVRLEEDVTDKDKYGRLLRYVYVDNLLVNLELVNQGFATSYTYPPDVKHQVKILAAEREARETNRGLWGACPAALP